jgi:hypothetical protein
MKPTSSQDKPSRAANWLVLIILVLVPFQALLTTWPGANLNHLDLFRIWKELLMVPLALYSVWLLARHRTLAAQMAQSWLVRCIALYIVWFLGFGLLAFMRHSVNANALLYSWITNLRLVGWFLIVWIVGSRSQLLLKNWLKIVLAPALAVVGFGLLQRFVLPADFLSHFGYGPQTIPAVETVDQKLAYRRIQSTLRGANPLGAYLIVVMTAALGAVRRHASLWWLLGASSLVLLFTYSRSAWLGAIVALALLVWYFLPNSLRKMALLLAVVAVLAGAGGISQLRHNDTVQNTVFHSDENSAAYVSSNAARSSAMTEGLREVWQQPFGRGPGTAGPASYRNFSAPRIAENYYIQLAQEVGVVGLALFVAINLLLVNELWRRRRDPLALVLLASLVGITLVNMLSHAWADDTLAVLWWGLAGVAMSLPASKNAILKKPNR